MNSTRREDRVITLFITQCSDQWTKLAGTRLKSKREGSSHSKQQNNRNPCQNTVTKRSFCRFKRNLDRHLENRFITACPAGSPHRVPRTELKIAGDQESCREVSHPACQGGGEWFKIRKSPWCGLRWNNIQGLHVNINFSEKFLYNKHSVSMAFQTLRSIDPSHTALWKIKACT